ncbi:MAG: nucleotidyltransferase domain-containing protein, partial [Alistipes sp.]|nr:nucleotidyltransferase domain-containing protein [Alistipes sp.]
METNRILAQSEPAQTSISESVTAANPASADPTDTNPAPAAPPTENPASVGSEASLHAAEPATDAGMPTPPEPSQPEPLYSQSEANDIVRFLTSEGLFDPEYILLFGSLAGGKPHSEAVSYDLLVVVRDIPAYDWWQAKHDLRCKLPFAFRRIPYINIYVVRLSDAEMRQTPFLYFAHRDGALLYCRDTYRFRRPKRSIDFSKPYYRAMTYYDTFKSMADTMLAMAMTQRHALPGQIRAAAYIAAQATITYYRVLYYVYHNEEF